MMETMTNDPGPCLPCREPLVKTLRRNVLIAVVVAALLGSVRFRHPPAGISLWRVALALFVYVFWISFGGHWAEVSYRNLLCPRLAKGHAAARVGVRLVVWMVAGAVLFLCGMTSFWLIITGEFPAVGRAVGSLIYGGPLFVVIELIVHTVLQLRGKPSFWNGRG
jgi:hypothetical protein